MEDRVVSYTRLQIFNIFFTFTDSVLQFLKPLSCSRHCCSDMRKIHSAVDGNGYLPPWVQRDKTIVSPQFSFPCGVSHQRLFSTSNFPKARVFFLPSGYLSLLYFNHKWLADQNCLKSSVACVAQQAARTAIETPGTLIDDKGFRQWVAGSTGTLGSM